MSNDHNSLKCLLFWELACWPIFPSQLESSDFWWIQHSKRECEGRKIFNYLPSLSKLLLKDLYTSWRREFRYGNVNLWLLQILHFPNIKKKKNSPETWSGFTEIVTFPLCSDIGVVSETREWNIRHLMVPGFTKLEMSSFIIRIIKNSIFFRYHYPWKLSTLFEFHAMYYFPCHCPSEFCQGRAVLKKN